MGTHAQVIGLNPTPQAEFYWNTSTNQWTACTNSSTAQPFPSTPQAFVQEGFNTSLGKWTPVTQCSSGSGGASITVNGGSPLTSPVNFQNSGGAGEINFTNPSGSNVQATVANAFITVNGITIPLGSSGQLPPFCAGPTCANYDQNNPTFTTQVITTTAAITSTSLVVPVGSTVGWPSTGCGWTNGVVEAICWDSTTSTSLVLNQLNGRRGINAYTAASHGSGTNIEGAVYTSAASPTSPQNIQVSSVGQLGFYNGINPGVNFNTAYGGTVYMPGLLAAEGGIYAPNGIAFQPGGGNFVNSRSSATSQFVTCTPVGTPSGLFCNDEGNWVAGGSGGGISGLTPGFLPQAASPTSIADGPIDNAVTNFGVLTSALPLYVNPTDGNDQTSLVVSEEVNGQNSSVFDVGTLFGAPLFSVYGEGNAPVGGWVGVQHGIVLGNIPPFAFAPADNSLCGTLGGPTLYAISCLSILPTGMGLTAYPIGSLGTGLPSIIFAVSGTSGGTPATIATVDPVGLELNYLTPSNSPLCYPTGSPAVVTNVGCAGGGLSGLVTGFFPIATSSSTVGNSNLDYNITNAGDFTFGDPVLMPTGSEVNGSLICTAANALCPATSGIISITGGVSTVTGAVSIVGPGVTQAGNTFTIASGGGGCSIGTCIQNNGTASQFLTQAIGTSLSVNGVGSNGASPWNLRADTFYSYGAGSNNGISYNGAPDWTIIAENPGNFMSATAGISQYEKCLFTHTAEGDSQCGYDYFSIYGNLVNANDEGGTYRAAHIQQIGEFAGPITSVTSGANSTTLLTVTGPSCFFNCSTLAFNSSQFPVGGWMVNQTTGTSGPYTISAYTPNVDGANEYTFSSGTVTPSTAIGTIASCTSSLHGQFGIYGTQTCAVNVVLGSFVTGSDVYHIGRNTEEDTGVTVTGSGSTQTVVMQSQWPFVAGDFLGQGGPGGLVFGPNGSSVSRADFIGGAPDSTHIFFGHCVKGACGSGGNVIKPSTNTIGTVTLSRASGTVTATSTNGPPSPWFWPVGSQIVVTAAGGDPDGFDGTFTVVSNTYNSFNTVITWAQSGATQTVTGAVLSEPLPQIKMYQAAMIVGTANGTIGSANLATNQWTWNVSDSVIGAASSEVLLAAQNYYVNQTAPTDFSYPSSGVTVIDGGPGDVLYAFGAVNTPSNGVAPEAFYANGSYGNIFYTNYDPANNGAIIWDNGANPVAGSSAMPFYLFRRNGSFLSILMDPSADSYTFGNQGGGTIVAKSFQSFLGVPSIFSAGTTIGGSAVCLVSGTNCPSNGITGGTTGYVGIFGSSTSISSGIALGTTGSDIPQLSGGLLASSTVPWAVPGAIGSTTPNSGAFTTLTATSLALGSSPPTCGSGVSGCGAFAEAGTAVTATAGVDTIRADSSHLFKVDLNGGSEFTSLMNFSTVNLASSAAGGVTGLLPNANIANPYTAISNPITSATGGSGTGTITCLTTACTNLRGTYSVAGGTFTTGTFLTLVWPTTTTAYACTVTQNGGAGLGVGNSVATATGVSFSNTATILGTTVTVNYSCQP